MSKQANVNFVERIRIQQELMKTSLGPWLPVKQALVNLGELTPNSAGMLAKFYTSNKNFVVDRPQPASILSTTDRGSGRCHSTRNRPILGQPAA